MAQATELKLEQIDEVRWRIPKGSREGMLVDGIIYADQNLMPDIKRDRATDQVANVACLPGIVHASLAMPDIHWGYGFCIGGVAGTDVNAGGVVSPGGVGYDINCGVRLLRTNLHKDDVKPRIEQLIQSLFRHVPSGVGVGGRVTFTQEEERKILAQGSQYVIDQGYGRPEDAARTESGGCLEGADPAAVSDRALGRGRDQCGTLGSGNHFAEVQYVEEVFDHEAAAQFGLEQGMVTAMIHSGSRGLGHQVCDDYLGVMEEAMRKYGIHVPDRQLACAPVNSPEGRRYLGGMRAAANFAWANRQIIMFHVRAAFGDVFDKTPEALGLDLIYDVAHNIAKIEEHEVGGKKYTLCVHRKGATRAFGPGSPDLPDEYRAIGQPVIIPGDMGRASYVLVGTETAMKETFGTTCHGAGRVMSRGAAIRAAHGRSIKSELAARGVFAMARSRKGLDEEQPDAYKNVNHVVDVVQKAGLSRRVCKLRPLGVIKG